MCNTDTTKHKAHVKADDLTKSDWNTKQTVTQFNCCTHLVLTCYHAFNTNAHNYINDKQACNAWECDCDPKASLI